MKIIVIVPFLLCVAILSTGFILEFLGFYKRMERKEKHHMDNDEFDYGHNVKYNEE